MKKGFTLLELLIVIGILAILASATVIILNPAELLRQARDVRRINDIGQLNVALAHYVQSTSSPALGTSAIVYSHNGTGAASSTFSGSTCAGSSITASTTTSTSRSVNATGWIPVNFTWVTGGSPFSNLPVDPSTGVSTLQTSGGYQLLYWYTPDNTNTTWELAAKMESVRYKNGGSDDQETNDGGTCTFAYEVGTDPSLNL